MSPRITLIDFSKILHDIHRDNPYHAAAARRKRLASPRLECGTDGRDFQGPCGCLACFKSLVSVGHPQLTAGLLFGPDLLFVGGRPVVAVFTFWRNFFSMV